MKYHKRKAFPNTGKLIRASREGHPQRYTQNEMSKILGYKNGQFISNVERGKCGIPHHKINEVSKILGIPIDDLIEAHLSDERAFLLSSIERQRVSQ